MTKRIREEEVRVTDVREPVHQEALQYLYKIKDLCAWHSKCCCYRKDWRNATYMCQLLERSREFLTIIYNDTHHLDHYKAYEYISLLIEVFSRVERVLKYIPKLEMSSFGEKNYIHIGNTLLEVFGEECDEDDRYYLSCFQVIKEVRSYIKFHYGWKFIILRKNEKVKFSQVRCILKDSSVCFRTFK